METLNAAMGLITDARDAGTVTGAMRGVDLLHGRVADRLLRRADATGRLEARDGGDEAWAGDPEARRHLARPLVLDNARQAERATGCDAERTRPAPELSCDGVVVFVAFSHQQSAISFSLFVAGGAPHKILRHWRRVFIEGMLTCFFCGSLTAIGPRARYTPSP